MPEGSPFGVPCVGCWRLISRALIVGPRGAYYVGRCCAVDYMCGRVKAHA